MSQSQPADKKKKIIYTLLYALPVIIFILDCYYWYSLEGSVKTMKSQIEGIQAVMNEFPTDILRDIDMMNREIDPIEKKSNIINAFKQVRSPGIHTLTEDVMHCLAEKGLPPQRLRLWLESSTKEEVKYAFRAEFGIHRDSPEEINLMACFNQSEVFPGIEPIEVVYSSNDQQLEIRATLTQN